MTTFLCPVCGYPGLDEPAWSDATASDEICPSCGTHFGLDDAAGGDAAAREERHRDLRDAWREAGCPWFSRSAQRPTSWKPHSQLEVFDW